MNVRRDKHPSELFFFSADQNGARKVTHPQEKERLNINDQPKMLKQRRSFLACFPYQKQTGNTNNKRFFRDSQHMFFRTRYPTNMETTHPHCGYVYPDTDYLWCYPLAIGAIGQSSCYLLALKFQSKKWGADQRYHCLFHLIPDYIIKNLYIDSMILKMLWNVFNRSSWCAAMFFLCGPETLTRFTLFTG